MNLDNQQALTIGEAFQRLTKYDRASMKKWSPQWREQVSLYKKYPEAKVLELPRPETSGGRPLWSTIAARRSFRDFRGRSLDLVTVSQLLWACQGITARMDNFEFRAAPSAGALYPVETYLAAHHLQGAERGIYHYNVAGHKLELLKSGDFRERVMQAGLMQPVLYECAVAFLWTAVVKRSSWKYGQRAYRYIYLDAGHLAQNLALAAESLDLGCCLVGALFDDEANELLGVDGTDETIIYMAAVGPK